MIYYLTLIPVAIALAYSFWIMLWLKKQPAGNEKMVAISRAIQEGSSAYLNRQYKWVAVVAVILDALLYWRLGGTVAVGFLLGAIASAVAGYIGMNVAVRSNSKTAEKASHGMGPALSLAFKAGSVPGFLVGGLGLFAVAGF